MFLLDFYTETFFLPCKNSEVVYFPIYWFKYIPIKVVLRAYTMFLSIHKENHWIQWLGTDLNIIFHYDVHRNLPGNKISFWIYEGALVMVTGVTNRVDLLHVFRLVKCGPIYVPDINTNTTTCTLVTVHPAKSNAPQSVEARFVCFS